VILTGIMLFHLGRKPVESSLRQPQCFTPAELRLRLGAVRSAPPVRLSRARPLPPGATAARDHRRYYPGTALRMARPDEFSFQADGRSRH
jgi:hypothetical protein